MLKIFIILIVLLYLPQTVIGADAPTPAKKVALETTEGKIVIELDEKQAPISTSNFLQYTKESFYNGLIFHRVIPGFVIQGGGFEPEMKLRTPTHPSIKNEADNGLVNIRGTVAMARAMSVDSATCQFYINLKDNSMLDHRGKEPAHFGYAVFGRVVEGMDVVDKIAAIPTGAAKGFKDVPTKDAVLLKAYAIESAEVKKPEETKKVEEVKK